MFYRWEQPIRLERLRSKFMDGKKHTTEALLSKLSSWWMLGFAHGGMTSK
jgi:hypothetical protein